MLPALSEILKWTPTPVLRNSVREVWIRDVIRMIALPFAEQGKALTLAERGRPSRVYRDDEIPLLRKY